MVAHHWCWNRCCLSWNHLLDFVHTLVSQQNENILRCPILTCSVRSAIFWNYRPETRKCAAFQTKRYEKLQEVWPHSIYEIYDLKHKRVWCPGTRPQKSPWAFRQRGTRPKACCASSGRKKLGNQVWSSHCGFPMALWLKQCHLHPYKSPSHYHQWVMIESIKVMGVGLCLWMTMDDHPAVATRAGWW